MILKRAVLYRQGGLVAAFDLAAFLVSMRIAQIDRRLDRPSNWICQSFENRSEHAQKADITPGNHNMFRRHFCLGFVFDPIFFNSLLLLFSNSSETISTKGMKDLLCVTLATSFRLIFSCRARWISYFYFAVEIFSKVHCLPSSHRRKRNCNYCFLISVEK